MSLQQILTTISTSKKMFLRVEKVIASQIDARSVAWTLSYKSKLANQIEGLIAIVVKLQICGVFVAVAVVIVFAQFYFAQQHPSNDEPTRSFSEK